MIPVEDIPVASVVDLVNEYAAATRRAAGEEETPYPPLGFLDAFGIDPLRAVAVADDLHRVFTARDPASELNRLADLAGLSHRLGDGGRLAWLRPATTDPAPAAAIASLVDFADRHGAGRFGVCAADACVDVFVDESRARTRAYCSDRCHSRTRVARWRERRRTE